jgi:predicted MFS family arabinose efflux permease
LLSCSSRNNTNKAAGIDRAAEETSFVNPNRRRTIVLAVVLAAYVLSFFHRFAPATIAQDLAQAFSTTAASLGVLAATYFYVYTVMQIPTGVLVDSFGPRRILLGGALIAAAGSFLFASAGSLDAALVGRTLIGLGVSTTFIAILKIIAVEFEERLFASLVGVVMLVGNFGSVLAGTPLSLLAQATGWRGVFMVTGLLSLLIGSACWLLVRDGDSSKRARFDRTVVLGGLLSVLKNRHTWPAVGVNFGICGSFFAFAGLWATPFLMATQGISRAVAANHLSLYFAAFAVGCLGLGILSDRLRRRKPVIIACALIYCALWAFWLSGAAVPLPLSYAMFALMGLTTASFSLSWSCVKEVNPPLLSGMSTSVCNMGGFLAAALLQPLVGWLMDRCWDGTMESGSRHYAIGDYRIGVSLLAAAAVFGLISAFFLRETGARNIWQAKA